MNFIQQTITHVAWIVLESSTFHISGWIAFRDEQTPFIRLQTLMDQTNTLRSRPFSAQDCKQWRWRRSKSPQSDHNCGVSRTTIATKAKKNTREVEPWRRVSKKKEIGCR
jgi:hypothetical protein